ncbi:putative long-chain-alcohol O-fatty-acyltransferase [Helianthus annuus]|nr:putative long-chain-alcohol O-fatty-acyltransferase [Helianthus annuus]
MEDNSELKTFIKIWFTAIASLCYCYFIPNHIPHGFRRLLSLLPVIIVFFLLPLPLTTVHLAGPTIFYLVWLGNFKLLLFAFNRGPLSSKPPLKLLNFISIALLPINPKHTDRDLDSVSSHKPILLAVKALILALIVVAYQYRDNLHPNVILGFYCCNVYLGVELVLAITAFFVRFILRFDFEIEPQFNEPYLASSLQDFWGRRWNLMVTRILRPTVYDPVREVLSPVIGKTWSRMPAIVATFVVSGLMHELIYWYFTRVRPTWEVTWFFVVHGVCTAVEVAVKKVVDGRLRLHRAVSGVVTVAFVAVTGVWLFLPQILRNGVDVKAIDEYKVVVNFLKSKME